MGHYHNSNRDYGVVIHHTGGSNHHTVETNNFCSSSRGSYDFAVTREGRIFVCRHYSQGDLLWQRSTGVHAGNSWCNANFMGISMHGCFGGCSSGNVSGPSEAQECSVAYLMSHTRVPDLADRTIPHSSCKSTVCPGTNFTSGTADWNANGRSLRDRLRSRRRNWDSHHCCFPAGDSRCPV